MGRDAGVAEGGRFLDRYRKWHEVGKGAFGKVYRAWDVHQKRHVAIKVMEHDLKDDDVAQIDREIRVMLGLRHHPCVVRLLDVYFSKVVDDTAMVYLVMDYADMDLHRVLRCTSLSEDHVKKIVYNLTVALDFLERSKVMHRDLTPSNVLMNMDVSVKLADFGLSRIKTSSSPGLERSLTKHVVTRWYRAPEVILLEQYGYPIDMWSLGCIAAEMFLQSRESTYKTIFKGTSCFPMSRDADNGGGLSPTGQLTLILQGIRQGEAGVDTSWVEGTIRRRYIENLLDEVDPKVPTLWQRLEDLPGGEVDPRFKDLLRGLLEFNPHKRLTSSEALKNTWFDDFREPSLEQVVPATWCLPADGCTLASLRAHVELVLGKELL